MRIYIALCVAVCEVLLCSAEDVTLSNGDVLHEVRVLRQDGESVTLSHTAGVMRVPYDKLPPELQKRYNLTPAEVEERREKARQAEKERALAREKKMAEQRAALAASNLSPRYLTGVDVSWLYAAWGRISTPMAEYLAADWNRREALRCGLTIEAERYKADAEKLMPQVKKEQEEQQKGYDYYTGLEERLRQTQEQLQQARQTIKKLEEKQGQQPVQQTTVISNAPTVIPVPVYRPAPVVLPPAVMPGPRPPAPRPRPAPAPVPVRPLLPRGH